MLRPQSIVDKTRNEGWSSLAGDSSGDSTNGNFDGDEEKEEEGVQGKESG